MHLENDQARHRGNREAGQPLDRSSQIRIRPKCQLEFQASRGRRQTSAGSPTGKATKQFFLLSTTPTRGTGT